GIGPDDAAELEIDLMLLYDAVLHGTVGDAHLAGLDPRHRAVLVIERNKTGLVFDPERSAEDLVAEAASLGRVTHAAAASVISLEALSSATSVRVSTAPKPVRGPTIRPAAVAGAFYEADPVELARTVDQDRKSTR